MTILNWKVTIILYDSYKKYSRCLKLETLFSNLKHIYYSDPASKATEWDFVMQIRRWIIFVLRNNYFLSKTWLMTSCQTWKFAPSICWKCFHSMEIRKSEQKLPSLKLREDFRLNSFLVLFFILCLDQGYINGRKCDYDNMKCF